MQRSVVRLFPHRLETRVEIALNTLITSGGVDRYVPRSMAWSNGLVAERGNDMGF